MESNLILRLCSIDLKLQVLTRRPASNGHLRHADLPATESVTQFTQRDIDKLKISFVSNGNLDSSAFYFLVSDGVHKSIYMVRDLLRIVQVAVAYSGWCVRLRCERTQI